MKLTALVALMAVCEGNMHPIVRQGEPEPVTKCSEE